MCIKSQLTNGIIVGTTGFVFTVIMFIVNWITVPQVTIEVNKRLMVLEEGNYLWDLWQSPSYPIYTDFYVFDCVNAEQVLSEGAKPEVVERGPYSYREYREKNIQDMTDEVYAYYFEDRLYYFSPETTGPGLSLEDTITTANPIYMTLSQLFESIPDGAIKTQIIKTTDKFLKSRNESVFMRVTVDELIFKGVPLQNYIDLYGELQKIPGIGNVLPDLPPLPDDLSFGLFSTRNNTDDGLFKVNRGLQDYREVDQIEEWGKTAESLSPALPYWKNNIDNTTSYCNSVEGTDGTVFPYGFDLNERFYIFQTDLCRRVYLLYEYDEDYEDLPGRHFRVPPEVLNDATGSPENECFCLDPDDEGRCPRTGAIFIGACFGGAPVIGSAPHFYGAVPEYINGVKGLNPNKTLHETYLILEARTNILLYGSKRVQGSIDLRKSALADTHALNDRRIFLPALWYDENVRIDEESKKQFNLFTIVDIIVWSCIAAGFVLILVGAGLIGFHFQQKKKRTQNRLK